MHGSVWRGQLQAPPLVQQLQTVGCQGQHRKSKPTRIQDVLGCSILWEQAVQRAQVMVSEDLVGKERAGGLDPVTLAGPTKLQREWGRPAAAKCPSLCRVCQTEAAFISKQSGQSHAFIVECGRTCWNTKTSVVPYRKENSCLQQPSFLQGAAGSRGQVVRL